METFRQGHGLELLNDRHHVQNHRPTEGQHHEGYQGPPPPQIPTVLAFPLGFPLVVDVPGEPGQADQTCRGKSGEKRGVLGAGLA